MEKPFLDSEEFERWRQEAGRALQSARVQDSEDIHNWACFSAEQAAQLGVKALLHGFGRGPWGHDLVRLAAGIQEAGIAVSEEILAAMRRLSRHYIAARYPDAHPSGPPGPHYGASDSTQAIEDAEAVIAAVDEMWRAANG